MPRSPYYPSGSVWTINGSQLNQIATACHSGIAFGRRHPGATVFNSEAIYEQPNLPSPSQAASYSSPWPHGGGIYAPFKCGLCSRRFCRQCVQLDPVEGLTDKQLKAGEDYPPIMNDNLEKLVKTLN